MDLGRRLARLEAVRATTAEVVGDMREGTEGHPDAVQVWPGGARLSVAEFARRYPRGTLLVIADYSLPHYQRGEDRPAPPPGEGGR